MNVSSHPMRVWLVSVVFGDVPSNGFVAGGAWIAPVAEIATAQFVAKVLGDNPHMRDLPLNGLSVIEIEEGAIRHFVKVLDENATRAQTARDAVVTLRPVGIGGDQGPAPQDMPGVDQSGLQPMPPDVPA